MSSTGLPLVIFADGYSRLVLAGSNHYGEAQVRQHQRGACWLHVAKPKLDGRLDRGDLDWP